MCHVCVKHLTSNNVSEPFLTAGADAADASAINVI
jgi:hypothetical protein